MTSDAASACAPFRSQAARDLYLRRYDEIAQRWPVPSESRIVTAASGDTFLRVSGPADGRPLVLLPGFGANSLSWASIVRPLSETCRTYAVDHIYDNGRSVASRPVTSRPEHMQWLDELLSVLEPDRPVALMGVSRGGLLAAQYVLQSPDRASALIMIAPAGVVLPACMSFYIRFPLMLIPTRATFGAYMRWLMPDAVDSDGRSSAEFDEMIDDMVLAARSFASRRPPQPDDRAVFDDEQLRSIRVPALYLVGDRERFCSATDALRRLADVAPQIERQLVANAGHGILLSHPDTVVSGVLDFLCAQPVEQAHPADGGSGVG